MTRKDYELIAKVINKAMKERMSLHILMHALALAFAEDNPRFISEKFFTSCLKTEDKDESSKKFD